MSTTHLLSVPLVLKTLALLIYMRIAVPFTMKFSCCKRYCLWLRCISCDLVLFTYKCKKVSEFTIIVLSFKISEQNQENTKEPSSCSRRAPVIVNCYLDSCAGLIFFFFLDWIRNVMR